MTSPFCNARLPGTITAGVAALAVAACAAAPAWASSPASEPRLHELCAGVTIPECERQVLASRGIGAPASAAAAVERAPSSVAAATAKGDDSTRASKARQAERLRRIEQRRLQALVGADVAVAGTLLASDFELINPLGEVLTRDDFLVAVGSGAVDFPSDEVTSKIRVRRHGNTAVLRYQHPVDIVVPGIGHVTHRAWTTALYERRNGRWQIVWEQTGAIGPLPSSR